MNKDFDSWNNKKKIIETFESTKIIFHEREIWWCSIGLNVGDEQDGKNELYERPVLVVKKFNSKIAWVIPMTTRQKIGRYYYHLPYADRPFVIILSQLRLTSGKRFQRFVRKIPRGQFVEIWKRLAEILLS